MDTAGAPMRESDRRGVMRDVDRRSSRQFWNLSDQFEVSQDSLFRYAMSLCRTVDRADDLMQETFLRALSHTATLSRLNEPQRDAWLKRVLRNRFFDEERARRRAADRFAQLVRQACREETASLPCAFDDLVEQLPSPLREVVERRYRLGMTSSEIGETLGIPAATVRTRLRQAILRLRMQLHSTEIRRSQE